MGGGRDAPARQRWEGHTSCDEKKTRSSSKPGTGQGGLGVHRRTPSDSQDHHPPTRAQACCLKRKVIKGKDGVGPHSHVD